jgi:hypothetical protein
MDIQEEKLGKNGMHQWNKEPRLKGAATSWKRKNIWQDLQEGSWAEDREAKSRTLSQNSENECQDIVEGSAPL